MPLASFASISSGSGFKKPLQLMFNKSRLVKRIVRGIGRYFRITVEYIIEYIKMRKETYDYSMILLNTHIKTSWMIASIKIFPK